MTPATGRWLEDLGRNYPPDIGRLDCSDVFRPNLAGQAAPIRVPVAIFHVIEPATLGRHLFGHFLKPPGGDHAIDTVCVA